MDMTKPSIIFIATVCKFTALFGNPYTENMAPDSFIFPENFP